MNNTKDLDAKLGFQNNFLLQKYVEEYLFEKNRETKDEEKVRELALQVCTRAHLAMKLVHDNLLLFKHEKVHKDMKHSFKELQTMLADLIDLYQITAEEIEAIIPTVVSDTI